ncbi:ATP-binding protein [Thermodesulfatator autotrophicus]|uniref:histidine kinase n=1 Tax=Thermodesulfatator autotrophicus TaxID=1795632 RepID=A0A177E7I9_9BACT|nr:ATP-binding protein [Thermodesulfatator autotrophicus]OAG26989.1 hypothetical protein TH606_09390 [Thermodesulfatator autotrophicus]
MESSLRLKVQIGYLILLIPLCFSLILSYISLNSLWYRIKSLETIDLFIQNLLEIRRYEKNFFLYKNNKDLENTKKLATRTLEILSKKKEIFYKIDKEKSKEIKNKLNNYLLFLNKIEEIKPEIVRKLGHELIILGKDLRNKQLSIIDTSFSKLIVYLFILGLISIGIIIGVGFFLAKRVVSPLEDLEKCMKEILTSKYFSVNCPSHRDKEVRSVMKTLDLMLKEIKARKAQLIQSEKLASLGTLLFGVAHELNNPLSNASSSCQILMEDIDNIDKNEIKNFIKQIDHEIWRARDIILALLEFSRYKQFDLSEWNLYNLIQEVLFILKSKIKQKNIKVDIRVDKKLKIYADKQTFQQALINLISNSIDAIENNGQILIKACYDPNRHGIFIAIEDNGCGIPLSILDKIFDPFFTTKGVKGIGLGLYLVNEIVSRHGGTIEVESEQGKGTIFYLFFPYKRHSKSQINGEEECKCL